VYAEIVSIEKAIVKITAAAAKKDTAPLLANIKKREPLRKPKLWPLQKKIGYKTLVGLRRYL
jgi:hypothetical protein